MNNNQKRIRMIIKDKGSAVVPVREYAKVVHKMGIGTPPASAFRDRTFTKHRNRKTPKVAARRK